MVYDQLSHARLLKRDPRTLRPDELRYLLRLNAEARKLRKAKASHPSPMWLPAVLTEQQVINIKRGRPARADVPPGRQLPAVRRVP